MQPIISLRGTGTGREVQGTLSNPLSLHHRPVILSSKHPISSFFLLHTKDQRRSLGLSLPDYLLGTPSLFPFVSLSFPIVPPFAVVKLDFAGVTLYFVPRPGLGSVPHFRVDLPLRPEFHSRHSYPFFDRPFTSCCGCALFTLAL